MHFHNNGAPLSSRQLDLGHLHIHHWLPCHSHRFNNQRDRPSHEAHLSVFPGVPHRPFGVLGVQAVIEVLNSLVHLLQRCDSVISELCKGDGPEPLVQR